jgi:hypothetical protein
MAIQAPGSMAGGDWPVEAAMGGVQSPSGVVLTVQLKRRLDGTDVARTFCVKPPAPGLNAPATPD